MSEKPKTNKLRGSALMILAAFIWGTSFVAQSKGLERIGNFTFYAFRSYLAVAQLLPVSLLVYKSNKKKGEGEHGEYKSFFSKRLFLGGLVAGIAVCAGSAFQQYGIVLSGVGKSGFLTTLYMLFVPLIGLVCFRRRPPAVLWVCIGIALCGMYFLCVSDVGKIGLGDILLICCAFVFAIHITICDHFVKSVDGIRLSLMQFAVSAVISTVMMFILEKPDIKVILECWFPVFYAGVLSSGVAFTLQILSQRDLSPTMATLLMSLESVFAALGGAVFGERLSPNEIIGCCLVFSAIIISQLPWNKIFKKTVN